MEISKSTLENQDEVSHVEATLSKQRPTLPGKQPTRAADKTGKAPPSRGRLRLSANWWRSLQCVGMSLHFLAYPRPPNPDFVRSIPSTLSNRKGNFALHFYVPGGYEKTARWPVVVNFHGGGFTIGNGTDDARFARFVLEKAHAIFVSVDYRLAPEYPFPTAVEDGTDALLYIIKNADDLRVDPNRIATSGFSAGGNIAMTAPLRLSQLRKTQTVPGHRVVALATWYPITDYTLTREERRLTAIRPEECLSPALTDLFDASYLYPPELNLADPYLSPSKASDELLKEGIPDKVLFYTCEWDMLLHEGEELSQRLKAPPISKDVRYTMIRGVAHGWDKGPNPMRTPRKSEKLKDLEAVEDSQAVGPSCQQPTAPVIHGKPKYKLTGLPRLDYNIMHYKMKLFIVTGLLLFEGSIAPVLLYYALTYGTSLREGIIFAIITSLFGFISGFEFALRSWRLILKEDTYRPLGEKRWRFDFTHQSLGLIYTIMTAILIGGSIPHPPVVRLLAIPMPLLLIHIGLQGIIMGWMAERGTPALVRISSVARGEPTPPFVLPLIEDVVAVDGDGKKAYRQRLMERWRVSRRFRVMIKGLNWFWGVGSLAFGIGLMVVVWTTPEVIAYGVAWGAPLIFIGVWTFVTVVWTRRGLHFEKLGWTSELDAREAKLGSRDADLSLREGSFRDEHDVDARDPAIRARGNGEEHV
ncbi:hypothetical protein DL769_006635 [Monosporascus sp. CRB-8-3]|nr:hypothetical protein DL769_006635 [Monosporascus sp. CRB-8-3]